MAKVIRRKNDMWSVLLFFFTAFSCPTRRKLLFNKGAAMQALDKV